MRPYKPSNKVSAMGVVVMLAGVVITGIIVGGLSFLVSQANFYILCLMPVILGLIGALAAAIIIGAAKMRNPFVALLFGIVVGGAIIFVSHFAGYYITFRNTVRDDLLEIFPDATQADVDELTNRFLEEEAGSPGFLGYLKFTANEGIFTSALGSSDTDERPFVRGTGTWIYWGIEFVVVAAFAAFSAVHFSKQPFDESANRWFKTGTWLGSIEGKLQQTFKNKLLAGDYVGAGQMILRDTLPFPRLDIMLSPNEAMPIGDTLLYLEECTHTASGSKTKIVMRGVLSPEEINRLRGSMPAPTIMNEDGAS
jgi:hypothetical protein